MKNLLLILAITTAMLYDAKAQTVGNAAPDFTFDILGGGSFTLSENEGKVVLIFSFGYSCHFCISSAPQVEANLINEFKENENFVPIGIDIWDGSASGVEDFKDETGISIPLLLQGGSFADNYNTVQDRLLVVGADRTLLYKSSNGASAAITQTKAIVEEALTEEQPNAIRTRENDILELSFSPNPALFEANIEFNLAESGTVNLNILSLDGRLISQVYTGFLPSGSHTLPLDVSQITTGMYIAQLSSGKSTQIIQFIKN